MRLLFLCPNLAAGGAERVWSILIPGLRRRGHDARVIGLDGGGPFADVMEAAGVPLEVLNMRNRVDLGPLLRSGIVRHFSPQVIVSQGVSGLYVGRALAWLHGCALVYNEHQGPGLAVSARRRAMVRLVRPWVEGVIVVAHPQIDPWVSRGYPRERIRMVRNGVEPAGEAQVSQGALRDELDLPRSSLVATLVATLRPEKRVTDFVAGIREAQRSCPRLFGVIVGDGPEREAIKAAISGEPRLRWLGHRSDVWRILSASDIFVLSSAYEASPMAVLEAMASGLPVIAPDVGGVPEIVEHGQTGLLVSPRAPDQIAGALQHLVGHPDLRRAMGEAGLRRHRERWSADSMIDGYADVFDQLARRTRIGEETRLVPVGGLRPDQLSGSADT